MRPEDNTAGNCTSGYQQFFLWVQYKIQLSSQVLTFLVREIISILTQRLKTHTKHRTVMISHKKVMIVDHNGVQKNRLKKEAVFKTWRPLSTETGEITTDHVEFRQGRHCSDSIVLRRIVVFFIRLPFKENKSWHWFSLSMYEYYKYDAHNWKCRVFWSGSQMFGLNKSFKQDVMIIVLFTIRKCRIF